LERTAVTEQEQASFGNEDAYRGKGCKRRCWEWVHSGAVRRSDSRRGERKGVFVFFAKLRNRRNRVTFSREIVAVGFKILEDKSDFFYLSPYTKLLFGKTGGKLVLD
jgi:hypothetical protein